MTFSHVPKIEPELRDTKKTLRPICTTALNFSQELISQNFNPLWNFLNLFDCYYLKKKKKKEWQLEVIMVQNPKLGEEAKT